MKYIKLGELCNIVSGGTPSRTKSEYWNNGTIPWIKIGNIKSKYVNEADEFITEKGLQFSSAKLLPKGTLLYTIFATLGECGILGIEACTNQAIAGLTIKEPENIFSEYIYYFLKSKKNDVTFLGRGVAQNNINLSMLRNFLVPVPSLTVQNAIINLLAKAECVIKLRKNELELLDNLIKARFVEMFGNPILNDKSWITSSIEDVCIEIYGGGTPSKQHPEYYENGSIPWVTSKDMKCDVICDSQIHINEKGLENSTARMVPTNSIIMVIRSGILKHTLPVAVNTAPITVNQDLKVFIPDSQKIMSRFFALQLKMHESDILSGVRAVTADNIEFNELKKRKIIVPPLVSQQLFSNFLIQIDKSKVAVQKSLDQAQLLFDSLMQQYFG